MTGVYVNEDLNIYICIIIPTDFSVHMYEIVGTSLSKDGQDGCGAS